MNKTIILAFFSLITFYCNINAQTSICQPGYFEIDTVLNNENQQNIDWCIIPNKFNLPKKLNIVFGIDPNYNDDSFIKNDCNGDNYSIKTPLDYGFSHISLPSIDPNNELYKSLEKDQRAHLFLALRNIDTNSLWRKYKLPYCNDLNSFYEQWHKDLHIDASPEIDLIVYDIETIFLNNTNNQILNQINNIKEQNKCIEIEDTNNETIISNYYRDISNLYNNTISFAKNNISNSSISSYSDSPILRTWWEIPKIDWEETKSNFDVDANKRVFSILTKTSNSDKTSNFIKNQDFITPSTYYFYNYDNTNIAGNYLAYLLFNIEANAHWSNNENGSKKKVIPFTWMRYHNSNNPDLPFIQNHMAEATSVFSIVSGADGIWQWDSVNYFKNRATIHGDLVKLDLTNHMYFIRGLYRLSKFNHILESKYKQLDESNSNYINPTTLFKDKLPVWRAIINENKTEILIAAHNPYAQENEETELTINYNEGLINWSKKITLVGREVFLNSFPLNLPNSIAEDLELFLIGGNDQNYKTNNPDNTITWLDKSNKQRHATSKPNHNKPTLNSKNILVFSNQDSYSNNDELIINNPPIFNPDQNWQLFFVSKTEGNNWQQIINWGEAGSAWGIYSSHANKTFFYTNKKFTGLESPHFFSSSAINDGKRHIYSLQKNENQYTWYLDGKIISKQTKKKTTSALSTGNKWTIAGHHSESLSGSIASIIVYSKALNIEEQYGVENFLNKEFNLFNCLDNTFTNLGNKTLNSKSTSLKKQHILISSNPTSKYLNLLISEFESQQNIDIINSTGKTVLKFQLKPKETTQRIDINSLTPGLYFLRINGPNKTLKFIIE